MTPATPGPMMETDAMNPATAPAPSLPDDWIPSFEVSPLVLKPAPVRRGTGPLGLNCDDTAIADADNARARRPRKGARS